MIKINLENGKSFIITSNQNQNKSQIELIKLNNQKTLSAELNYFAVTNGGNLDFIFSDSKSLNVSILFFMSLNFLVTF